MPEGQQRKIKGAICNVPFGYDETCNILPHPPERSGIILLKLKRKIQFRGHVFFEAVRPEFVMTALNWLKANNILHKDIQIDCTNISTELTSIMNNEEIDHTNSLPINSPQNNLDKNTGREIYNIASGENKHPVSLMTDKQCEELAFPVLFPNGKFGYIAERDVKLSPVKYFNARLLHYSGQFATNPEYLFFAQFIIEQTKVSNSINIALKKVHGQSFTASQVRSNTQILQNLISQDQAYLFLRQIPGSPPYYQKFMYEVVEMVKQLGIPTWFMTLSCTDLRWPELFQIIARTNGKNMTDEEVEALSYDERCRLLNLNLIIVAKHFQYRVETFFTEILLTNANPFGKLVYYALFIEFQMRGSPIYMH